MSDTHHRVRRRAPRMPSALVPAFRVGNAVGGYAMKRAALPQGGIRVSVPSRGAPYASSGASPAAAAAQGIHSVLSPETRQRVSIIRSPHTAQRLEA